MDKFLEKGGFAINGKFTPNFFEEWAKRHLMKAVRIERDPDGDILLADSIEPIRILGGVYRSGYAIHRSGLEIGNYHDYPMTDFLLYSEAGGVKKRTDEALEHARETQEKLKEAGYYDAERKGRFNIRPH